MLLVSQSKANTLKNNNAHSMYTMILETGYIFGTPALYVPLFLVRFQLLALKFSLEYFADHYLSFFF
jgi:tRNA U34 5-methylaminomethyl-2-thiouridine-forming methyltransferase MnmC